MTHIPPTGQRIHHTPSPNPLYGYPTIESDQNEPNSPKDRSLDDHSDDENLTITAENLTTTLNFIDEPSTKELCEHFSVEEAKGLFNRDIAPAGPFNQSPMQLINPVGINPISEYAWFSLMFQMLTNHISGEPIKIKDFCKKFLLTTLNIPQGVQLNLSEAELSKSNGQKIGEHILKYLLTLDQDTGQNAAALAFQICVYLSIENHLIDRHSTNNHKLMHLQKDLTALWKEVFDKKIWEMVLENIKNKNIGDHHLGQIAKSLASGVLTFEEMLYILQMCGMMSLHTKNQPTEASERKNCALTVLKTSDGETRQFLKIPFPSPNHDLTLTIPFNPIETCLYFQKILKGKDTAHKDKLIKSLSQNLISTLASKNNSPTDIPELPISLCQSWTEELERTALTLIEHPTSEGAFVGFALMCFSNRFNEWHKKGPYINAIIQNFARAFSVSTNPQLQKWMLQHFKQFLSTGLLNIPIEALDEKFAALLDEKNEKPVDLEWKMFTAIIGLLAECDSFYSQNLAFQFFNGAQQRWGASKPQEIIALSSQLAIPFGQSSAKFGMQYIHYLHKQKLLTFPTLAQFFLSLNQSKSVALQDFRSALKQINLLSNEYLILPNETKEPQQSNSIEQTFATQLTQALFENNFETEAIALCQRMHPLLSMGTGFGYLNMLVKYKNYFTGEQSEWLYEKGKALLQEKMKSIHTCPNAAILLPSFNFFGINSTEAWKKIVTVASKNKNEGAKCEIVKQFCTALANNSFTSTPLEVAQSFKEIFELIQNIKSSESRDQLWLEILETTPHIDSLFNSIEQQHISLKHNIYKSIYEGCLKTISQMKPQSPTYESHLTKILNLRSKLQPLAVQILNRSSPPSRGKSNTQTVFPQDKGSLTSLDYTLLELLMRFCETTNTEHIKDLTVKFASDSCTASKLNTDHIIRISKRLLKNIPIDSQKRNAFNNLLLDHVLENYQTILGSLQDHAVILDIESGLRPYSSLLVTEFRSRLLFKALSAGQNQQKKGVPSEKIVTEIKVILKSIIYNDKHLIIAKDEDSVEVSDDEIDEEMPETSSAEDLKVAELSLEWLKKNRNSEEFSQFWADILENTLGPLNSIELDKLSPESLSRFVSVYLLNTAERILIDLEKNPKKEDLADFWDIIVLKRKDALESIPVDELSSNQILNFVKFYRSHFNKNNIFEELQDTLRDVLDLFLTVATLDPDLDTVKKTTVELEEMLEEKLMKDLTSANRQPLIVDILDIDYIDYILKRDDDSLPRNLKTDNPCAAILYESAKNRLQKLSKLIHLSQVLARRQGVFADIAEQLDNFILHGHPVKWNDYEKDNLAHGTATDAHMKACKEFVESFKQNDLYTYENQLYFSHQLFLNNVFPKKVDGISVSDRRVLCHELITKLSTLNSPFFIKKAFNIFSNNLILLSSNIDEMISLFNNLLTLGLTDPEKAFSSGETILDCAYKAMINWSKGDFPPELKLENFNFDLVKMYLGIKLFDVFLTLIATEQNKPVPDKSKQIKWTNDALGYIKKMISDGMYHNKLLTHYFFNHYGILLENTLKHHPLGSSSEVHAAFITLLEKTSHFKTHGANGFVNLYKSLNIFAERIPLPSNDENTIIFIRYLNILDKLYDDLDHPDFNETLEQITSRLLVRACTEPSLFQKVHKLLEDKKLIDDEDLLRESDSSGSEEEI